MTNFELLEMLKSNTLERYLKLKITSSKDIVSKIKNYFKHSNTKIIYSYKSNFYLCNGVSIIKLSSVAVKKVLSNNELKKYIVFDKNIIDNNDKLVCNQIERIVKEYETIAIHGEDELNLFNVADCYTSNIKILSKSFDKELIKGFIECSGESKAIVKINDYMLLCYDCLGRLQGMIFALKD